MSAFDTVLVVDFGAQYAQLIARRVREAHVYSEIVPRSTPVVEMLARRPKAIILSGGPASVHVDGAPSIDPAIYDAHVPLIFTGAGIKPGLTIGRTDELGYNVAEDPVDVHDLHATMLRLMGIDHEKLTYKFQGRDFRLTDVHGKVVTKLLA